MVSAPLLVGKILDNISLKQKQLRSGVMCFLILPIECKMSEVGLFIICLFSFC